MSTIKNLVKTFKERQASEVSGINNEKSIQSDSLPSLENAHSIEEKALIAKENIKTPLKPITKEQKQTSIIKAQSIKQSENKTIAIPNMNLSADFFASLNEQTFSYEQSKFAYIDKKLYEVLMTLKRKKDVKNISLLINAALAQFIEQNKDEIKNIFMDDTF